MRIALVREIDFLEQHVSFLATTGSTAPFVGLFGTVWGIMNSFESIGLDQNTSLTAVAPGIAEALFATALGLVVTIPAVIAYNKVSLEINRYQNRLEAFIEEFSSMISLQMEE
jgi:biopolymer transport protein TolQ